MPATSAARPGISEKSMLLISSPTPTVTRRASVKPVVPGKYVLRVAHDALDCPVPMTVHVSRVSAST